MHWTRKSQTLFILLFNFTDITGSQRYRDAFQQSHEQRQSQKPKPKYLSLIRAGKYFSRSQHPGIEEQKDVAMHLKQGRWMVLFYSEGELVVEDKLNFLQFRMHLWRH